MRHAGCSVYGNQKVAAGRVGQVRQLLCRVRRVRAGGQFIHNRSDAIEHPAAVEIQGRDVVEHELRFLVAVQQPNLRVRHEPAQGAPVGHGTDIDRKQRRSSVVRPGGVWYHQAVDHRIEVPVGVNCQRRDLVIPIGRRQRPHLIPARVPRQPTEDLLAVQHPGDVHHLRLIRRRAPIVNPAHLVNRRRLHPQELDLPHAGHRVPHLDVDQVPVVLAPPVVPAPVNEPRGTYQGIHLYGGQEDTRLERLQSQSSACGVSRPAG